MDKYFLVNKITHTITHTFKRVSDWTTVSLYVQVLWSDGSPSPPLSSSTFTITYSTCCTRCHHKQLGRLLSARKKRDEWQVSPELCQVTQVKIHDTEPSNTTVEHICQSGRPLQNRDHTLFIRASKMSRRRGSTAFCLATANNSRIVLLVSFSLCRPIIFSSICYSHLNYRLAPRVGRSVSEPGLLRPGKTRRSQTNKKPKRRRRAAPNLVPVRGTSREHPQRNLQTSPLPFPLPASLLPSLPTLQAIRITDDWTIAKFSQNAASFFSSISLFFPPSRVSVFGASPHGLGSI